MSPRGRNPACELSPPARVGRTVTGRHMTYCVTEDKLERKQFFFEKKSQKTFFLQ